MIRILNEETIKLIRAGEVIERPASVVSELIDNALDAGADNIVIRTENGGRTFLSVTDNGCGIHEDSLPLAFHPHATSKLDDINCIHTLGFRGEALSSIKHVSETTIISRTENGDAWTLDENNEIYPASGPKGTFITVKNLFENFPARHRFMKGKVVEGRHIRRCVENIALCHHNVSFYLDNHGYMATTREGRINSIFGNEFLNNSMRINREQDDINIDMYIGNPTWNRHASVGCHLFINGRPVSNSAFRNFTKSVFFNISKEKPSCILWLTVPYNKVDCNIHPSKKEVRFLGEDEFFENLLSSVREKLGAMGPRSSESLSEMAVRMAQPVKFDKGAINLPLGKPIGMFKKNFIISEASDGLILVDLHAAHERVVLQKIIEAHKHTKLEGRKLDKSVVMELNPRDIERLEECEEKLEQCGFHYVIGNNSITITEVPEYVSEDKLGKWIESILRMIDTNPYIDMEQDFMEEVFSLMACHNAFRRKDLTIEEMDTYLREIENIPFTAQCNHGRPTSIVLTFEDVDKMFKR